MIDTYSVALSEFMAIHEDSVPEGEKPKGHFCQIFSNGIQDDVWTGKKICERRMSANGV